MGSLELLTLLESLRVKNELLKLLSSTKVKLQWLLIDVVLTHCCNSTLKSFSFEEKKSRVEKRILL